MKICIDSLLNWELRFLFGNNLSMIANLWSHVCQIFYILAGKRIRGCQTHFICDTVTESFQFVANYCLCRLLLVKVKNSTDIGNIENKFNSMCTKFLTFRM